MIITIRQYIRSESGAVTVDWVVLTAAILGISVAVMGIVAKPTLNTSSGIGATIEARKPGEF